MRAEEEMEGNKWVPAKQALNPSWRDPHSNGELGFLAADVKRGHREFPILGTPEIKKAGFPQILLFVLASRHDLL